MECWDENVERFVSWWRRPDTGVWETTAVEAVQSLFPLMLALPPTQRDALVRVRTHACVGCTRVETLCLNGWRD
jgi:hypothetical protein